MRVPFPNGSLSSRAQTLESITVCTEILGDPHVVGEVLQLLHRTQQRRPGSWRNRPGINNQMG